MPYNLFLCFVIFAVAPNSYKSYIYNPLHWGCAIIRFTNILRLIFFKCLKRLLTFNSVAILFFHLFPFNNPYWMLLICCWDTLHGFCPSFQSFSGFVIWCHWKCRNSIWSTKAGAKKIEEKTTEHFCWALVLCYRLCIWCCDNIQDGLRCVCVCVFVYMWFRV